jgi:hypothetical protein
MHPITFFPSLSISVAPKCHFPFNFQIKILILEGHITRKFTLKNQKKSMDKRHPIYMAWPTWPKSLVHTSETWRLQLSINASISINQNLAEADVKFELVKFCYIFFILYAINDILLKTVKNNIVACLCNVFYTNLSLEHNNTIQYNTIQINKEFNTMITDWLNWLEDDNILWNKTSFDLCSPIT